MIDPVCPFLQGQWQGTVCVGRETSELCVENDDIFEA